MKVIRLLKKSFGKTIEIDLRGRVDLDKDSKGFFEEFAPALQGSWISDLVIDLSETTFLYPSALLFILGLRDLAEARVWGFAVKVEEGGPIHDYLLYVGCDKYFGLPDWPKGGVRNTDPVLEPLYGLDAGGKIFDATRKSQQIVDLLSDRQRLSELVEANVIDSVEEILRNIGQHSGHQSYRLLGQVFPSSQRVRFAFYDDGVGIKEHMTRLSYERTHPLFRMEVSQDLYRDMASSPANLAIDVAGRNNVSATDYSQNSGAGFNFLISDLSIPTNGLVSILSGDGYVRWESGKLVESIGLDFEFRGTMVSWMINYRPGTTLVRTHEVGHNEGDI